MFDRFIKLLYFLTWYFLGMVTFSYATRLNDLLDDNNLLHVCELSEKILRKFNYNLNELDERINRWGIKFYLSQFLYHNDRDFLDCCCIFYLIKTFKNIPLTKEEEARNVVSFIVSLDHLNNLVNLFHIHMTQFGLTEEEHNFLANLDYNELIRKIRAFQENDSQHLQKNAPQSQPIKTSCTLL